MSVLLASTFPHVDPIPIPAPVWLFKVLHDLTLGLHFLALHLLLGGMLVSIYYNWRGHRGESKPHAEASDAIAGWLPIIMTYVINLGVPPLLFAQVLYGRALYTSSILIGVYWIAVIPMLIACYHLLYVMKARGASGQAWYGRGLISLLLAWGIARIYSMNMTLMLAPEVWSEAYRNNPAGFSPLDGPASWPRWVYMLSASLGGIGVLMFWLSKRSAHSHETREILKHGGVKAIFVGSLLAVGAAVYAWVDQAAIVRDACSSSSIVWTLSVAVFVAGAALMVASATRVMIANGSQPVSLVSGVLASLGFFLQTVGFVVCRDLVRDATLSQYGFDVWDRTVSINWSVLLLFFLLFVIGLGIVGWLSVIAFGSRVTATNPAPAAVEAQS